MLGKHKHRHPTHDFDGITDNRESKIPWYFSALFFGLLVWGAGYMGYFLFSGWTQTGEYDQKMAAYEASHSQAIADTPAAPTAAPQVSREELLAQGAGLYSEHCRACHGETGKGGVGPDLTQTSYRHGRDAATVTQSIAGGRPGGMPRFGNKLSPEELQSLTTYVLSLE